MELKKNELNEEKLEQVSGGGNPQEHNVMLSSLRPEDIDPDKGSFDFEKAKDGRIL